VKLQGEEDKGRLVVSVTPGNKKEEEGGGVCKKYYNWDLA
jgi:hypothetical protein